MHIKYAVVERGKFHGVTYEVRGTTLVNFIASWQFLVLINLEIMLAMAMYTYEHLFLVS